MHASEFWSQNFNVNTFGYFDHLMYNVYPCIVVPLL